MHNVLSTNTAKWSTSVAHHAVEFRAIGIAVIVVRTFIETHSTWWRRVGLWVTHCAVGVLGCWDGDPWRHKSAPLQGVRILMNGDVRLNEIEESKAMYISVCLHATALPILVFISKTEICMTNLMYSNLFKP